MRSLIYCPEIIDQVKGVLCFNSVSWNIAFVSSTFSILSFKRIDWTSQICFVNIRTHVQIVSFCHLEQKAYPVNVFTWPFIYNLTLKPLNIRLTQMSSGEGRHQLIHSSLSLFLIPAEHSLPSPIFLLIFSISAGWILTLNVWGNRPQYFIFIAYINPTMQCIVFTRSLLCKQL